VNLPPPFLPMFVPLAVEKTGRQIVTGLNTVAGEAPQGVVKDIGTKVIDGAQLILSNHPHHPKCFICLGVEDIPGSNVCHPNCS